jgi:hypothetical protein
MTASGPIGAERPRTVLANATSSQFGLSELLSRLLVAFTVEFDGVAEQRIEHRRGNSDSVWLASQAMWANFLQFVPADGVPLDRLASLVPIINMPGLRRWRYVRLEPDPAGRRPTPDTVVWMTRQGALAAAAWSGLADEIEQRWRTRFGSDTVTRLSAALAKLDTEAATPYLPMVNFADGMRSDHARGVSAAGPVDLSVRLSHVLLALTLDYESRSQLSLPLVADVLIHLGKRDSPVPEVVAASGVSKVAINVLLGFLQRRGLSVVSSQQRRRLVRLTGAGMEAREQHLYTLGGQWKRHRERYGAVVDELSAAALAILDAREVDGTPGLAEGLRPLPDGWRAWPSYLAQTEAFVADPWRLPAQPMVLHRGGYPDGS